MARQGAGELSMQIGQLLAKGLGEYERDVNLHRFRQVSEDPKATALQIAKAAADVDPKAMNQYLKLAQTEQLLADIQKRYGVAPGSPGSSIPPEQMTPMAGPPTTLPQRIPTSQEMMGQMGQIPQSVAPPNPMSTQSAGGPMITPGEILETTAVNPALGRSLADISKMQQKERLEIKREEREIRKETQPYVDELIDRQKALRSDLSVYDDMEVLSKTGKLTTPLMSTLLHKAGLPLGILKNPESEEFDKLSNQLTRTIQKYYGSRILQTEFQNFLRQIPTLQNSEEGRQRIIKNLRKSVVPAQLEYDAYKEVMKETGGKRPADLKERVAEKLLPSLDNWLKDMKSDLQKTLPHQVPEGTLIVIAPTGERFAVPKEQIGLALAQGGKLE